MPWSGRLHAVCWDALGAWRSSLWTVAAAEGRPKSATFLAPLARLQVDATFPRVSKSKLQGFGDPAGGRGASPHRPCPSRNQPG